MKKGERVVWMVSGVLLIGAIVATAASRPRYTYGRPDRADGLSRDPYKLLPTFAAKVEKLFERMRARGLDPILHEAYRTRERAEMLAKDPDGPGPKRPAGIPDSMHIYGAAVDIISRSKQWADPKFFEALGEEAKKLKLTWGGDFGDMPHVQAVPYTLAAQNAIRHA